VDSVGECAEKTPGAPRRPEKAREFGAMGRELVRERFLLAHLIADSLRLLYGCVLGTPLPRKPEVQAGLAGEEQDPACGVRVGPHKASGRTYRVESHHLCSESCREQFKATPASFSPGDEGRIMTLCLGGVL